MAGRILWISMNSQRDGFDVIEGIKGMEITDNRINLGFSEITFSNIGDSTTYITGGYKIDQKREGFKKIFLFNKEISSGDYMEEYLLVIIPFAWDIKTTARKIAGVYPTEAIIDMGDKDKLEISRDGIKKTYIASKVGEKIILRESR